jgi:DNA-3-methyladenine glycosylase I
MKNYKDSELIDIFQKTEATLKNESNFDEIEFEKAVLPFKNVKIEKRSDNYYFWVMVYVTFYSGFRAATVTQLLPAIEEYFGDIDTVAKYDEAKIQEIIDSKRVIGNRNKITACIHNAKQIKKIQNDYGSFDKYLEKFGDTNDVINGDKNLAELIKDLRKSFKYLGKITVYHFLMEIGFNVVKPDRVLCRIFNRLELIANEEDYSGVVKVGRQFSIANHVPIRHIDIIFVAYGQVGVRKEFGLDNGVCLEKNPICELCGIYEYCNYDKKKKL